MSMDSPVRRLRSVVPGALILGLLWLAASPLAAAPAVAKRPNVLWIIAEDMGCDLGCYGTREVSTPNVDRLASQGCRYRRAFSAAPICSVARSALMTGAYPTAFGAQNHRSNRQPGAPGLPEGVRLLSDRFRGAGYFTANLVRFPRRPAWRAKAKPIGTLPTRADRSTPTIGTI
jgi:hypothetical protein